jgi:hypothetical protein
MQRLFITTTDPSNRADFLRISLWDQGKMRAELLESQLKWAIEQAEKSGQAKELCLNTDDSLGEKDPATWRLEVVDIHHDHTRSTPSQPRHIKAYCYLACTMCVGEGVVTLDVRLSLRTRTVRAINRGREPEKRIRFRSKNTIAQEPVAPHLPSGWKVIVQFDSWYASNKILRFVHR